MDALPRLRTPDRAATVALLTIDELVSAADPVRAIWSYVCAMDLDRFRVTIRARDGTPGRNATDPRLLVAVWMFATVEGGGSARRLARLCVRDVGFRWLCGGVTLNHHLLSDFRTHAGADLEALFHRHVAILMRARLVHLKRVAQDGMRVRASAGAGSFRRLESLERCEHQVAEPLRLRRDQPDEPKGGAERRSRAARERHRRDKRERLQAAREDAAALDRVRAERLRRNPPAGAKAAADPARFAARASSTDPDSRRMKMPDGGYRPGYNVQAMSTTGEKIIVAVDVTNQGTDGGLLGPMLDRVEAAYGRKPTEALVDGGFASGVDVERAARNGITVFMPPKGARADRLAGRDPCAPKRRDGAGMKALRARMGTADGQAIYAERASTAERVNAGMRNRGLYQFRVRGRSAVRAVVVLHALVHNLFQTIRLCAQKIPSRPWADVLREGSLHTSDHKVARRNV